MTEFTPSEIVAAVPIFVAAIFIFVAIGRALKQAGSGPGGFSKWVAELSMTNYIRFVFIWLAVFAVLIIGTGVLMYMVWPHEIRAMQTEIVYGIFAFVASGLGLAEWSGRDKRKNYRMMFAPDSPDQEDAAVAKQAAVVNAPATPESAESGEEGDTAPAPAQTPVAPSGAAPVIRRED